MLAMVAIDYTTQACSEVTPHGLYYYMYVDNPYLLCRVPF